MKKALLAVFLAALTTAGSAFAGLEKPRMWNEDFAMVLVNLDPRFVESDKAQATMMRYQLCSVVHNVKDEFERREKTQAAVEKLKRRAAEFDREIKLIGYTAKIGEYDFNKGGFPVKASEDVVVHNFGFSCTPSQEPMYLPVQFIRWRFKPGQLPNFLPIPADQARELVRDGRPNFFVSFDVKIRNWRRDQWGGNVFLEGDITRASASLDRDGKTVHTFPDGLVKLGTETIEAPAKPQPTPAVASTAQPAQQANAPSPAKQDAWEVSERSFRVLRDRSVQSGTIIQDMAFACQDSGVGVKINLTGRPKGKGLYVSDPEFRPLLTGKLEKSEQGFILDLDARSVKVLVGRIRSGERDFYKHASDKTGAVVQELDDAELNGYSASFNVRGFDKLAKEKLDGCKPATAKSAAALASKPEPQRLTREVCLERFQVAIQKHRPAAKLLVEAVDQNNVASACQRAPAANSTAKAVRTIIQQCQAFELPLKQSHMDKVINAADTLLAQHCRKS